MAERLLAEMKGAKPSAGIADGILVPAEACVGVACALILDFRSSN
jgi:hypothetical protein